MASQATTLLGIPLDWYKQMRETNPVYLDPRFHFWQVFRYDDAMHVLTDPATFSSEPAPGSRQPRLPSILGMDEPRHRKLRTIVSTVFTPHALVQLTPRITEVTNELIDAAIERGALDVVQDLAYPLPITIIAALLGVQPEDRALFQEWSTKLVAGPRHATSSTDEQAKIALSLRNYFTRCLNDHRQQPRDDLMTRLINAEVDGEQLSQEELLDFCQLLLIAGYETTANLIGNAMVAFEDHPEAVAELRADPALMKGAVEEILRCYPSVAGATRVAKTETMIGEQRIEPNQVVSIHIASANYDERQFPEPERFAIRREPNRHIAFGYGIHFCLGAPLARLEANIALNILLERFSEMRRIANEPVNPIQAIFTFGVEHFPVTFKVV